MCLNTYGSVRTKDVFTATEGLVRDWKGGWIIGFSRYLWNCAMLYVEFWDILDGLKLVLDQGFEWVLIQFDNLETINTI